MNARHLKNQSAQLALLTLRNKDHCIKRHLDFVMLKKALYLFFFIQSKKRVAVHTTFDDLRAKASHIITSTRLDTHTLAMLGLTADDIGMAPGGEGTIELVELVLHLCPRVEIGEADLLYPRFAEYHAKITLRMASHLHLVLDNLVSVAWEAGGLLVKNPGVAQAAARNLRDRLARLRPGEGSSFERHMLDSEVLLNELGVFADREVPCLLWRAKGAYKHLYIFLAQRFLSGQDSVLASEGLHARWKWLTVQKRGCGLVLLNSLLKVKEFLRSRGGPDALEDPVFLGHLATSITAIVNSVCNLNKCVVKTA